MTDSKTECIDGNSADPHTAKRSRSALHEPNGTTFKALPRRRRRRSQAITCAASPLNASNFSVDNPLTTTYKAARNAPKSAFVEQNAKGSLEDAQNRFKDVPPKSMTMEVSLGETRESMDLNSSPWKEKVEWDEARDTEILRLFSYNRLNLVLDSMCPHIAPHIVITPAEETWEDESIPWQNSVDPQWPFYLCVPPLDYSNGRMLVIEPHPLSETQTDPILFNTTQSPSLAFGLLRPVFRPSIFEHSANESSQNENQSSYFQWSSTLPHVHDLSDEMMNFQKAACKATFFSASDIARALRKRYDFQPNVLSDVEPGFTWTDPAEPLLIANRRMLGATILDSICPFLTPHIIINSPPPQPYHLTENNTTPYTQDAAFGDRLVVEASYTSIINETGYSPASSTSIVDNWKDQSFYCSSLVDLDESTIDSRPGSPLPETPDDHDDDHYFHFAQFDDGVLNENGLAIHHEYQSIYRVDSPVQVDLYAQKFQATSRSIFYIEEDDDELPSLDDW